VGSALDATPAPVIAVDPVGSIVEAALGPDGLATATFDKSRDYRYRLSRVWDDSLPRIVWCMLNPSMATASVTDPTLARTVRFSRLWGAGAVEIVNLFAWRTPDPAELRVESIDPVGPRNDEAILEAVGPTRELIAAWGNHGAIPNPDTGISRSDEVRAVLGYHDVRLSYLRLTQQSQPGHPLYIPSDTRPIPWM